MKNFVISFSSKNNCNSIKYWALQCLMDSITENDKPILVSFNTFVYINKTVLLGSCKRTLLEKTHLNKIGSFHFLYLYYINATSL